MTSRLKSKNNKFCKTIGTSKLESRVLAITYFVFQQKNYSDIFHSLLCYFEFFKVDMWKRLDFLSAKFDKVYRFKIQDKHFLLFETFSILIFISNCILIQWRIVWLNDKPINNLDYFISLHEKWIYEIRKMQVPYLFKKNIKTKCLIFELFLKEFEVSFDVAW